MKPEDQSHPTQNQNTHAAIRFGPAGNSDIFYEQGHKASHEAPAWLHNLGLSAYEYSFGRGVRMSEETAARIAEQAALYDIRLSIHMPYFINLAAETAEKQESNLRYFLESLHMAQVLQARRAVFHPGSLTGVPRETALSRACTLLKSILSILKEQGLDTITLCPETMGKINQLGDLNDVLTLCALDERLLPCIDFGHLHCRNMGSIQGIEDYAAILDAIEGALGLARARRIHIHFSRIEFTKGGEKKHHTFADTQYGPEFAPLAQLLAERQYTPVVICESKGTMAEDAVAMREMYTAAVIHK